MSGMGRRGEELIDQTGTLVGARVGEKRADAIDRGDRAAEVDRDAAKKVGIGADRGRRADGVRFDDRVTGKVLFEQQAARFDVISVSH